MYVIHIVHSKDILKILRRSGWREVGRKGRDMQLKHPTRKGRVTLPHPVKDVPKGTIASIERQSGLAILPRRAKKKR